METAALNSAHIDITLVHKWFDEEGECLAAGPERRIGSDMRPERFYQFEAAADVRDDLR